MMLLIIGLVFILLWILGFTFFNAVGWVIHILLGIALIMIVIWFINGR